MKTENIQLKDRKGKIIAEKVFNLPDTLEEACTMLGQGEIMRCVLLTKIMDFKREITPKPLTAVQKAAKEIYIKMIASGMADEQAKQFSNFKEVVTHEEIQEYVAMEEKKLEVAKITKI